MFTFTCAWVSVARAQRQSRKRMINRSMVGLFGVGRLRPAYRAKANPVLAFVWVVIANPFVIGGCSKIVASALDDWEAVVLSPTTGPLGDISTQPDDAEEAFVASQGIDARPVVISIHDTFFPRRSRFMVSVS